MVSAEAHVLCITGYAQQSQKQASSQYYLTLFNGSANKSQWYVVMQTPDDETSTEVK